MTFSQLLIGLVFVGVSKSEYIGLIFIHHEVN